MGELNTGAVPILEGEILAGKYRLGRVLGQGGMGVVVAATHVQLEQRVALKFLRAEALGNPEVVARFTREAQAAARIRGVHVARVLDVGELPSGVPYIVMEYLEGEDLECVLGRRGPLPIAEAVDLLLQACEAVAEAHTLGIVHRDLKPANLFLACYPGGRQLVKVLDFGISKLQGPTGNPRLTQAASMFGSPPYMAPEQVRSTRAADVRSDIWSLGAVLYELLTLATPFPTESIQALFAAILVEAPAPPRALREQIPPALEAAILRCLQKDPSNRFQDVAALAAALGPFGSASSADVPARIAHIMNTGVTGMALSATAVAESAPTPVRELGGPQTIDSPETSQGSRAATAAGKSEPSVPQGAPAPVGATAPTAPRSRASWRLALALVLAISATIATTEAYRRSTRTFQQPPGAPSVLLSPHALPSASLPPPILSASAPGAPSAVAPPSASHVSSAPGSPAPAVPAPAVPAQEPRRPDGTWTRPHEQAIPAGPSVAVPSVCADLLARQSLGETLTPEEASTYARACKKQ